MGSILGLRAEVVVGRRAAKATRMFAKGEAASTRGLEHVASSLRRFSGCRLEA